MGKLEEAVDDVIELLESDDIVAGGRLYKAVKRLQLVRTMQLAEAQKRQTAAWERVRCQHCFGSFDRVIGSGLSCRCKVRA